MLQKWICKKCGEEFWYDSNEIIKKVFCQYGNQMERVN